MDDRKYAGIVEATRLTRNGDLAGATALIRRTLGLGDAPSEARTDVMRAPEPIEATFRVTVEPEATSEAPGAETPDPGGRASTITEAESPIVAGRLAEMAATVRRARAGRPVLPPHPTLPGGLPRSGILTGGPGLGHGPALRPGPKAAPSSLAGRWIEGTHTSAAGTRAYKLYIPSGSRGQAMPLVVMLHGCTQDPDDFAAGTGMNVLAEAGGFLVAYPAQAASANGSKCWNWFQAADQQRDRGEPSLIAGITRQVAAEYRVDAGRVYVAGLSAGGAMAAIMGATYSDLYAAVGVHSGLAPGSAHDLPSAFQAMKQGGPSGHAGADRTIPMILFQGDRDQTVHPSNADHLVRQWAVAAGPGTTPRVTLHHGQVDGGRSYTRAIYHDTRGQVVVERWIVHNAGHAWSGGSRDGSYTDPDGPDASREMVRFFNEHPRGTTVSPKED